MDGQDLQDWGYGRIGSYSWVAGGGQKFGVVDIG